MTAAISGAVSPKGTKSRSPPAPSNRVMASRTVPSRVPPMAARASRWPKSTPRPSSRSSTVRGGALGHDRPRPGALGPGGDHADSAPARLLSRSADRLAPGEWALDPLPPWGERRHRHRGTRRISHSGAVSGYTTTHEPYPDEKAAIVVYTNIYPGHPALRARSRAGSRAYCSATPTAPPKPPGPWPAASMATWPEGPSIPPCSPGTGGRISPGK